MSKRPKLSSARPATLARKRALVRTLIERHGWASRPELRVAATAPVPDNVIQFPITPR